MSFSMRTASKSAADTPHAPMEDLALKAPPQDASAAELAAEIAFTGSLAEAACKAGRRRPRGPLG